MAELKIYITAEDRASKPTTKIADTIGVLGKKVIQTGKGWDEYTEAVKRDLRIIDDVNTGNKSLEKQLKLVSVQAAKMAAAFGSGHPEVQKLTTEQSKLQAALAASKAKAAAQQKAMEETAAAYERLNMKVREMEQAVKDTHEASMESWSRYTAFVQQQQQKLDSIQSANNAAAQNASSQAYSTAFNTSVGSFSNDYRFYDAIGDSVSKAQLELSYYEQQLKRVLATENASPMAISSATQSFLDQKKVVEGLSKTGGVFFGNFGEIFKNITKFQLVMMPVQRAIRFVSNTISESMEVAAEAEQVFSKLTTVFENNATALGKATDMAQSYGTAVSTMASTLSTVGDILQAQGMGRSESLDLSSQWAGWFSDIIAFKDINMAVEEFSQNFMSGAAGNLRNFRMFGSIVKESAVNAELARKGLSDLTGEELELEKMIIRATMALEQQSNALGATEREWDTVLSVNRRLDEQWKQFKENLGDTLNKVAKPLKSWLSDILTEANKVTAAMKEINSGEFSIKNEAVAKGEELTDIIKSTLGRLPRSEMETRSLQIQKANVNGYYMDTQKVTGYSAKQLADVSLATGASIDLVIEAAKNYGTVFDDVAEEARKLIQVQADRLKRESERTSQLQKLEESNLKDYKDSLAAMFDNTGDMASWLAGSSFTDKTSADYLLGRNKGTLVENPETAASDIAEVLAYLRMNLPKLNADYSALISQRSTAQSEFSANAFMSGGTALVKPGSEWTQEEAQAQKQLIASLDSQIVELAKTIGSWEGMEPTLTAALTQAYTQKEKETAAAGISSATASLAATNASTAKRVSLERMYPEDMSYMVDIRMQEYEYEKEYAELMKTLTDAGFSELEATDLLKGYKDEYTKAIQSSIESEEETYLANKEKARLEKEASIREQNTDAVVGMFGEAGQAYSLAAGGIGEGGTELVSFLVSIASQLEVVQEISSLLSDTLVPVLDSFLKPMLPLIQTVSGLVQSIVQGVLAPLFPIIVEVCAILTLIAGSIKTGIDFVVNSIKWVIGNLAKALLKAIDKLIPGDQSGWYTNNWIGDWSSINPIEEANRTMQETLEAVEEIRSNTFDIKENTQDEVDLSFLNELLAAGVIDEKGYNERAKAKQVGLAFDTVKADKAGYIDWSTRQTTVRGGNVTVNISGGDPDKVKQAVISALRESGYDPSGLGYQYA